jgi:low temperature requirement protein LtrA
LDGLRALRRRWPGLSARSPEEEHRASTPLELLFDLTFVVAVSQVAKELATAVADDHPGAAIGKYLMVFFAIWWAWMNFTWFASAYDADDVPYRLLTLLQMLGVLVVAAGVPAAFSDTDFTAVTIGYVVMRVAMVVQWLRAARGDVGHRRAATRYAIGILAVQVGWLLRLALPDEAGLVAFFLLVAAELAVPLWAEREAMTTWHPHHIAERYGLFVIIVLGECVLAATVAVEGAITATGWRAEPMILGAAALALVFGLWWIYFLKPAGSGLERRRDLSFWWGYGHYGIFAGLAALGAGLEVAAEAETHPIAASDPLIAAAVGIPVILVTLLVFVLHAPLSSSTWSDAAVFVASALVIALLIAATAWGLPPVAAVVLMVLPVAGLIVVGQRRTPAVPVPGSS